MRLLSLFCLWLAFSQDSLLAQEQIIGQADEWVLTRSASKTSWKNILASVRELEIVETFGPREKYALVRTKRKLTQKLPREIIALQRNYIYKSVELQDPDFIQSWGLSNSGQSIPELGQGISGVDVGALKTWQIESGSKKVSVAVLDTGIDMHHEDLKNNLWTNYLEVKENSLDDDHNGFVNDIHGWNFVNDTSIIQDDNNHGSAVSGVIGADAKNGKGTRGLAENISLMTVKILDANGSGTTERAVRGIEYAVKNGAAVINASWGGTLYDQVLFDTIKWANEQGVLVVCAAGNEGKNNDIDEQPIYPASFKIPNILSVAAHDFKGELAPFSNFGKQTVHVSAPGVGVFSSVRGGYQFMNGTSFAAPFVAAMSALLKWREPELKPEQISKRISSTTIPMHYYVQQKLLSGGRVHSFNALKNISSFKPETPIDWKRISKSIESYHPYTNNSQTVFEIKQPGATHIRAHFVKMDLEKQYDYIRIKDEEGRMVISYSGKSDAFWSADVLGPVMRIELVSDFSNAQWGFAIDAIETTDK